ncbi:hypothetical protein ACFWR9_31120 [Streptomyces sp. NPDC058534]|uniref:hypothetical protein n=1 Tax=Streptomyces sp. NPDC058534 TaxID=3346541 RepID=UPI00364721CB
MTDSGPVLVVTNLDDPTADVVISELHDRGVPGGRVGSGGLPPPQAVAGTLTANRG